MSAIKSIVFALHVATQKRDGLVQVLNRNKRSKIYAEDQMEQLNSYALETNEKWVLSSQRGTSPELMCHHYQFMARLEDAIVLQAEVLIKVAKDVELSHQNFLQAELRIATLELMQKKMQSSLDAMQARKEQKQTDEFAATRRSTIYDTV